MTVSKLRRLLDSMPNDAEVRFLAWPNNAPLEVCEIFDDGNVALCVSLKEEAA